MPGCKTSGPTIRLTRSIPSPNPRAMHRIASALLVLPAVLAGAQTPLTPPAQSESDAYTRYELLAPGSAKFRIVYEVTATSAGATFYFNPIRKGSVASNESVFDRATGKPLQF